MAPLAEIYDQARTSSGDERLVHFGKFYEAANEASSTLIYGPGGARELGLAFANIAHNFGGALMVARLLRTAFGAALLRSPDGTPCTEADLLDRLRPQDAILLQNGWEMAKLLNQASLLLRVTGEA